ncbi:hypothetical protein TREMEDRAFT_60601 [Tremella mesenterica DSM 1558]|uniref:uncharacterized protein n=1 Tax=Tremella mesenterica (strain ATCC 24925 / CBS 8224 / DSM 1558 / NBRC 9311 / NRRL Y-6157 / RJB 2259-6 / UBC 559-6) TaxID=578456 RepID=UPI0003F4955A|nr:uncharacterized protein TREMEDRAFT_60601 [Tremella mesenterica DSM 1558]EIW71678.1 hypothetical protein TREMEDRAFT_60601 [Tremella mesenterica DSM 1558]
MSLASTSSTSSVRCLLNSSRLLPTSSHESSRRHLAAAARAYIDPETDTPLHQPSSPRRPIRSPQEPLLTPLQAQAFLSNILSLPLSHQLSPELSLQILTHKSFRYAHFIRPHGPNSFVSRSHTRQNIRARGDIEFQRDFVDESDPTRSNVVLGEQGEDHDSNLGPTLVSHNARLSFLGRRAISSYLTLFVHSALPTSGSLRNVDFLRGETLDKKLDNMRHVNNLGRTVGDHWHVGEVMRWDKNPTSLESDHAKIKGMVVEATLGGVYTTFGSPAAHRAFHLLVLPRLAHQLRDPGLIELANKMAEGVRRDFGGVLRV